MRTVAEITAFYESERKRIEAKYDALEAKLQRDTEAKIAKITSEASEMMKIIEKWS